MSSSSSSGLELDPLLKDLTEKKSSFRSNVKALMAELNDVRSRLASQQESLYRETKSRQAAETKARSLDEEIGRLQKFLGERDGQLKASTSLTDLHLRELDDLRSQLSFIQTTAEASTAVAHSAQSQCLSLLKELDEKNNSLKDHESKVNKLGEQLDHLQKDLQARELSQKQLKDEVMRVEKEIMHAVTVAGANKDCELRKMLDEISPKNIENINKRLNAKDEEIARLRDEIRYLSTHWKLKTEELESQLEKHRRADQELKKRVLKLEFCLQEAKAHMRKLQRMGERRDKALKELRDQVGMKKHNGAGREDEHSFWESSGFKLVVTMSVLVLVAIVKRNKRRNHGKCGNVEMRMHEDLMRTQSGIIMHTHSSRLCAHFMYLMSLKGCDVLLFLMGRLPRFWNNYRDFWLFKPTPCSGNTNFWITIDLDSDTGRFRVLRKMIQ